MKHKVRFCWYRNWDSSFNIAPIVVKCDGRVSYYVGGGGGGVQVTADMINHQDSTTANMINQQDSVTYLLSLWL